jgi:Domain of unknown function (DUF1918)
MMRARVGDQLVRAGSTSVPGEIVGVLTAVHGGDGEPPSTVRRRRDCWTSKIIPDPERYRIGSQLVLHHSGAAMRELRGVA